MKVKCSECDKSIEKLDREYKRRIKVMGENVNFFCDLSCTAKFRNKNLNKQQRLANLRHLSRISEAAISAARIKNYKGKFSYYIRKARSRGREIDIDNRYLEQLWREQNGECALSGIPLIINKERHSTEQKIYFASLDRIDSNKGYLKGNVRFISTPLNYAKNNFNEGIFEEFLITTALGILKKLS